jgi:hypothetical protein
MNNKRTLLQVKKKELKTIITSQEERAQNYHYKSRRKSSKLYKNKTQNKHFYRK